MADACGLLSGFFAEALEPPDRRVVGIGRMVTIIQDKDWDEICQLWCDDIQVFYIFTIKFILRLVQQS